jgi:type IV pilus assembly protein PilB
VTSHTLIGQQLVQAGHIDGWQLQSALAHQRFWGGRIGDALVKLGFLSESVLLGEIARQLGVPCVQIASRDVDPAVVRLVPERLIRARRIFPIAYAPQPRRGLLVIATARPQDLALLDEVAFASGKIVNPALASDRDIEAAIERHFASRGAAGRDRVAGAMSFAYAASRAGNPLRAA